MLDAANNPAHLSPEVAAPVAYQIDTVTPASVAEMAQVSVDVVLKAIEEGHLPATDVEGVYYIAMPTARAWATNARRSGDAGAFSDVSFHPEMEMMRGEILSRDLLIKDLEDKHVTALAFREEANQTMANLRSQVLALFSERDALQKQLNHKDNLVTAMTDDAALMRQEIKRLREARDLAEGFRWEAEEHLWDMAVAPVEKKGLFTRLKESLI